MPTCGRSYQLSQLRCGHGGAHCGRCTPGPVSCPHCPILGPSWQGLGRFWCDHGGCTSSCCSPLCGHCCQALPMHEEPLERSGCPGLWGHVLCSGHHRWPRLVSTQPLAPAMARGWDGVEAGPPPLPGSLCGKGLIGLWVTLDFPRGNRGPKQSKPLPKVTWFLGSNAPQHPALTTAPQPPLLPVPLSDPVPIFVPVLVSTSPASRRVSLPWQSCGK